MQLRRTISASFVLCAMSGFVSAQRTSAKYSASIPQATLIQIMRAEDERRWDDSLKSLLSSNDAAIRKRAALAAGRIGVEAAVPVLAEMVLTDKEAGVREMAAFALGEIESAGGAYALVTVLKDPNRPARARSVEALGKMAAALVSATGNQTSAEKKEDERLDAIKAAIIEALRFEDSRRSNPDRLAILLGLTAVLRARPDGAGPVVVKFLDYPDSSIVATALNTMARLRMKDANERVRQLLKDGDPIVRANAARVIGAAEHKEAFDDLLARALNDPDLRVRASAIRSLASLREPRAADPLIESGAKLLTHAKASRFERPSELNEMLEIATALGVILRNQKSEKAIAWLKEVRKLVNITSPVVEVAFARIDPMDYMFTIGSTLTATLAGQQDSIAAGLSELATAKTGQPSLDGNLREFVTLFSRSALECTPPKGHMPPAPLRIRPGMASIGMCTPLNDFAVPDFLRTYAAVKPDDLSEKLRVRLGNNDVVIRATAAELLGEQPPSEANMRALIDALPRALSDKDLDDAAMAILGALAKQKNATANEAIKTAFNSQNHLIRRRAVALLKANGAGDFSDRIGTVQTRNKLIDYRRAIARFGKKVTATIVTSKGSFTIEFLPEEAPLTIDNFIQLARRGYFNGQTIPRVVPNFVIQAGDPRGDQNGGPGYSIRCEINEVVFERASIGMALSGKDTGGSQWFVTHSPQPHLDGGYTVFGRVIRGMDVVDSIARGDTIRQVIVNER
ncbi:MAG TPA: peptidylprolyl isomerase [Pyrinomonadaceae bacterium]|nr:peptidylprolyl isomerase [Pyrinomonadaceae bacterium]